MTDTCYIDLMEQRLLFIGQEALNTSFWVLTWHFAAFLQEFTRALCALFALERKKIRFFIGHWDFNHCCLFYYHAWKHWFSIWLCKLSKDKDLQHMSTNWNLSLIREASFKITLSLSPHFPVVFFHGANLKFLSSLFVPGSILMRFINMATFTIDCHTKCIRHNDMIPE